MYLEQSSLKTRIDFMAICIRFPDEMVILPFTKTYTVYLPNA